MARAKKTKISVLNWMGTLLLCSIPGVNLIAIICFLIFAKSPSKKSFALAWLLLLLLAVILLAVALVVFGDQAAPLAASLRDQAAALNAAPTTISLP